MGDVTGVPGHARRQEDGAIRVLFTHPHYWPHVRRGAEREIHDLGALLARRGHRVGLVTSTPTGVARRRVEDGVRVLEVRVPGSSWLEQRGWHHEARFGVVAGAAAAVSRADLVHSFLYADAAVVGRTRAVHRDRPLVLKLTGTVRPERIARTPVDDRLFRRALARATEVWVNSRFAAAEMAAFDVPLRVVPAGVDTSCFRPAGERASDPLVVCTSAPDEPRKRVVDLVAAWPRVLAEVPTARLVLAGHASTDTRRRLLDGLPSAARERVRFAGLVDRDELLRLYRRAWLVVQPSVHEALGLSVLEALACGTPVVGARSGATVELVEGSGHGGLFPPADPGEMATTLAPALVAPPDADAVADCRAAALAYDWSVVGDLVEAGYRRVLEG